jgi:hypothetical protein
MLSLVSMGMELGLLPSRKSIYKCIEDRMLRKLFRERQQDGEEKFINKNFVSYDTHQILFRW